ncbi:MAG: phosphate/phosphite/phosphonate ABC transporter substrate-binding protein [Thaumarchaeota archaeon]|nr:phosphate/phosphite/phosphonate ABC transporter substrate-binding protein [Nitrososphaerota archaeon]
MIKLSVKMLALAAIMVLVGVGIGSSASSLWTSPQTVVQDAKVPQKLVIAIQPTEATTEIAPRAKQLEDFLESRLEVDVEIYIPTTYAAGVEALRFGNADAAFMSAWPTYIANKVAGAEIVLAEVREVVIDQEKRNEPFYFSYWIVPKDSSLNSLSELKGKRACFPSQISTSGYVVPLARMVELGLISKQSSGEVDPKTFFGEVIFGGGYGQCWTSLKAGQVDVTIIAGDVSESLYREVIANTKVLEKQGPIPSHGVVFSKNLKEPLRSKLTNALLELGTPEHRDLMRRFISGIFVNFKTTTTTEHIAGLQKALDLTGFKFTERLG